MISFAHRDMRRKTSEIFNERRWEGKIINCNNNCENILSFFSGHTKSLFLLLLLFDRLRFRTDTRRFSSLGFHQSTNENMCADAFSSPEKVLLLRSSRLRIAKKKTIKLNKNLSGEVSEEIFLEFYFIFGAVFRSAVVSVVMRFPLL